MNLRDLQYLVSVADLNHFGKAALACNVSQPTLSMQLKKLEETLDVTLFERTNKHVMITPIGTKIVQRARSVLQETQAMRDIAKTAQDAYGGDFKLGAFPTLAPYYLPLITDHISKKLPALKLWLVEEKTEILLEKLHTGMLDAALIALPITDHDLDHVTLFEDPFYLAVAHAHPLAKQDNIRIEHLAKERVLLLEDGHCLRHQALEVCSLIGMSEHQDFRATSMETLRQMVASGVGITFIPRLAMRAHDGITYIPFEKPALSRTIGLVWRKTSARKTCIKALVELMIKKE
jgi:LysR family transcriptional regulator, hydrogen peroxide-inducible genes activator